MSREQEIKAREKAATSGKWYVGIDGPTSFVWSKGGDDIKHMSRPDAEFIAHAREDIPYLLAELKEARETLAAVEEVVASGVSSGNLRPQLKRILKGGD